MSIAEKLTTIAENEQKVYDAGFEAGKSQGGDTDEAFEQGRQAEKKAIWDAITNSNKRKTYNRAFYEWDCEYIRPPYKITPTDEQSGTYTFYGNKSLIAVEKECFDFSKKATSNSSNSSWQNTFASCSNLKTIEDIGLTAQYSYINTFRGCSKLVTIAKMGVGESTAFTTPFYNCTLLEDITIEGTIGKNGFDVSMAKNISKLSLLSILNACKKDVIGQGISITLPSKCIDGATDTETLMSETGDSGLYGARMCAISYGYSFTFA